MKRRLIMITLQTVLVAISLAMIVLLSGPLFYMQEQSPSVLNTRLIDRIELAFDRTQATRLPTRAEGSGLQIRVDGQWQDLFVKGVNIGAALPGQWFTQFPQDEAVYRHWLDLIGAMHANCIRVYTLLPPAFYNALADYNRDHPEAPLWLLQELWPEENPAGQDYLQKEYVAAFKQEIRYGVDAIHGQASIAKRSGRAYGIYTSNVSDYVLGYLVGRELEPDEVVMTNEKNAGYAWQGKYLSTGAEASPTEAWLAMNCDYVADYEEQTYRRQHPVAIVSWPTLDVAEHDSEWNKYGNKSLEYNDSVSIDINHIDREPALQAGFFGAYHIYPNYPDFMNNESKYDQYKDAEGRLRYGGYLQEFMEHHRKYPALVAEFGLATGMGVAHFSPDGLNHGGLTEEEQGKGIVRMMKAIQKEGYAGGMIFEWLDEWAKKTWKTEPYMIPYERHVFWHNAIDPEQNYGLLAFESDMGAKEPAVVKGNGPIRSITVDHDAAFLYLDVDFSAKPDFGKEKLLIGLDTYDRSRGEMKFSPRLNAAAPGGLEFLVDFTAQNGRLLVQPDYNPAQGKYSSLASSQGVFEEIHPMITNPRVTRDGTQIAAFYEDSSHLNYGDFTANSHNHYYWEGTTLHVRLPWGRINFTDPSSLMVLDDNSGATELTRDQLHTVKTEGIVISTVYCDTNEQQIFDQLTTPAYQWPPWESPIYHERLKQSYYILQQYFKS